MQSVLCTHRAPILSYPSLRHCIAAVHGDMPGRPPRHLPTRELSWHLKAPLIDPPRDRVRPAPTVNLQQATVTVSPIELIRSCQIGHHMRLCLFESFQLSEEKCQVLSEIIVHIYRSCLTQYWPGQTKAQLHSSRTGILINFQQSAVHLCLSIQSVYV